MVKINGLAIRNNRNYLYGMKKAVGAILFHCFEMNDESSRHPFCPQTEDTWCKWQYDKLKRTNTCKSHISIPKWIHDILKPIFMDLSSDTLLRKCLHGETQNTNECLNSIVWTRCPRNTCVSKPVFEMAIHSAILNFYNGTDGVRDVFSNYGLFVTVTNTKSIKHNIIRVKQMNKKTTEKVKKRRKDLRTIKKDYADKEQRNKKVSSYISGGY